MPTIQFLLICDSASLHDELSPTARGIFTMIAPRARPSDAVVLIGYLAPEQETPAFITFTAIKDGHPICDPLTISEKFKFKAFSQPYPATVPVMVRLPALPGGEFAIEVRLVAFPRQALLRTHFLCLPEVVAS